MSKPVARLGRGLSALIAPAPVAAVPATHLHDSPAAGLAEVPVERIRPNPRQPRQSFNEAAMDELVSSIRSRGLLQPIVVRRVGDSFELIAGERRWRAAQRAGLTSVPAIVRSATDAESFELALIENLQREDLNPLERATAYHNYVALYEITTDELARRLGESRPNVANYLRLLNLSPEIRQLIASGELGMGQARAIAGLADPARQLALARLTVRRNLSVRQVEQLAKHQSEVASRPTVQVMNAGQRLHLTELERALGLAVGMPVKLRPGRSKNSGKLVISYRTLEEFDRLAERLGASLSRT